MRFFTKEGICARLAEKDIPLEPAFEFRKITMLDTVDLDRYRGALAKATQHNQPIQVFDPPKHYFNQPKYLVFSRLDCLLERLTDEDSFLLSEIFGVEHHYWIPQNLNNFDKYYKIFSESEKKPAWDLLRVIAFDTWANYVERQSRYEWLLEGGLNVRINNNEAIDLTNNMYRFPAEIIDTKKLIERVVKI